MSWNKVQKKKPVVAVDNDDAGIDEERSACGKENWIDAELWMTLLGKKSNYL